MDCGYGYVDGYPANVNGGFHVGWDYRTPEGVIAVAVHDGIITEAAADRPPVPLRLIPYSAAAGAWGMAVTMVIDEDGFILVDYCHLSAMLVKPGDRVRAGDPIGLTGATGLVTAEHLHLQVRQYDPVRGEWRRINPESVGMVL